eukprot:150843-Amphidinium_carterae.1
MKKVVHTGKHLTEFLLQFVVLKSTGALDEGHLCPYIEIPRPLSCGKKAWNLFAAWKGIGLSLKELGHVGVSVSSYCFDRGALAGLKSHVLQDHVQRAGPRYSDGQLNIQELLDWPLVAPCILHDVHNSLKWSIASVVGKPEALSHLHLCTCSLRDSFTAIFGVLPAFIASHLEAVKTLSVLELTAWRAFWLCMDIEPEVIDVLCELQLRWSVKDEKLMFCERWSTKPDLPDVVFSCLAGVFRFKVFTESRWLSIGLACRTMAASMALGLEGVMTMCRADATVSDYTLAGWKFLSSD